LKTREIDSTFIDVYYNLGWALIECGKYEQVITMYRNLLKNILMKGPFTISSEDPRIYVLSGHINFQLNELNKALKDFQNAYRLNPEDKISFTMICDIKARIGQNQEAKKSLLDFLQSNPDFAPAHYTLAMIYVKENDYQEALNELKEYLRLEPGAVDHKQVEAMIEDLEKYLNKGNFSLRCCNNPPYLHNKNILV
jgi:tetratricopeptide (TPR) repeat protein